MDLKGFNASEVEPNEGFTAIPAGDYQVVIIESKEKPTKAGTGSFLELRLQVLNGPHQNRQLIDRLNLKNPNPKAVQIAKGTLSSICRAVNILTPADSSLLHGKPMTATVKAKRDPDGNLQNEVKGYKARNTQASATQTATAQPAAQQATSVAQGSPFPAPVDQASNDGVPF